MSILDIIKPITLLAGSHADTGATGQGCAMNVIAYLKGEAKITDKSTCVCVSVRPIIVWLNDCMVSRGRGPELLPYILRAMDSTTGNLFELSRRVHCVATFARACAYSSAGAATYAEYACADARYVEHIAADADANYAAAAAAQRAICAAQHATSAAIRATAHAFSTEIIDAGLRCLDDALPAESEFSEPVRQRAQELALLANKEVA